MRFPARIFINVQRRRHGCCTASEHIEAQTDTVILKGIIIVDPLNGSLYFGGLLPVIANASYSR